MREEVYKGEMWPGEEEATSREGRVHFRRSKRVQAWYVEGTLEQSQVLVASGEGAVG